MLTIAALILIVTCEFALGQDAPYNYSLDMAMDSVDDQYDGCSKNMSHLVQTCYLKKEIRANNCGFGDVWKDRINKSPEPQDNLSKNHSTAIYVYTSYLYSEFNKAVRNGTDAYKKQTFEWYSLYFWLTEALQILKETQPECKFTYRATNISFNQSDVLNKEIRFGSFASSSLDQNATKHFGSRSCFEIYTCHGADVTKYSKLPHEKEVLIPPYEKFNITAIKNDSDWCDTVYILKSSGIQNNLNCAVAHHKCPSLSLNYIRGEQITSPRAFLSDPHKSFLVKSKHGNKKWNRLRMLRVQQRMDSKIFHQYRTKGRMSDFVGK